jgi:toxin ParE1/3/4
MPKRISEESSSTSSKSGRAYLVNITVRAERDFAHLYNDINAQDSDAAFKWYQGLKAAILTLENHPNRCAMAPENANLRHLLYGHKPHIYRVIYRVIERRKQVDVLHIRDGARRGFGSSNTG